MSREDFAKLFGISKIVGFAYGEKVYTWLIWVCSGIFLVYTWFDCLENHGLNAVILLKNNVVIVVNVIGGALKYYISQNV